ncbi:ATP-dependent helicase [Cellulosilyticum sp. I15G10I2]|uniref:ATP-dependent helicase n=1 Tax=Cellulosilyticum sp. I15G10I2 TaxID=1892843 RepID=UPI001A9A3562|nr:3'-5' exonuclease [Cellulosilyticum sp. I15G10I2]
MNRGENVFEEDYISLNEAQRQVVTTTHQNALVLAPAGTGKTKVIAMRSTYLIRNNILPKELLCLTFTNKAAKEMKERINLYLPEQSKDITIKTFHAFCYILISSEKQASRFSFPCTIIDETDSDSIIKKIIEAEGFNDERIYYPELRTFIENIKRHSLNFNREERYYYKKIVASYFKEQFGHQKTKKNFIIKHGFILFNAYQNYLKENNCIDFMDLIVEARYLLEQNEIKEKWNKKYKYIQVDEMQDTSIREYEIIKMITGSNNLSMFGDFNQTIYEWRGSNPKGMVSDFKKDFKPKYMTLSINYRSTKVLLEAANNYIRNSHLYPIQCMPTSHINGDKISIIQAPTKKDEINLIAESIKLQKANQSIVVLTRTNEYAKVISETFQKQQIPCTLIEDTKFFRRKEVKDLLAFFDYSINQRNGHALLKICHHAYLNMEGWLLSRLNHTKDIYMFLCDWFSAESKDPYANLQTAYMQHQIIVLDVESTGLDTTKDDIIQIAAIRYGRDGIRDTLDILVKPTQCVGNSYFVHGFSDEVLQEKGLDPSDALKKLLAFVENSVIVGHNVNYDLQIIKSMLNRYHLETIQPIAVYDTLDLAYKIYPHMSNYKLETLANHLNTHAKPNHNALQDILATSEILTHLLNQIRLKAQDRFEMLEALYSYIGEYKHKVLNISHHILNHSIPDSISYMMNTCEFKKYYSQQEIKSIREFYRISRELYDQRLSIQDNIIQLLNYAAMHYSEIEQSELFKDRIPIITIHQAKGLEFDDVYIAGCNDKVLPLAKSIRDNHLEEEKRLFYVGMTRARKNLFLSYHHEAPKSIFIDEIGQQYIQYKTYSQKL